MYKIAIAGASTLLGKELKEALSESPLAAANFVLLDDEEAEGQLDRVGDEVTFVQAIAAGAFEHADFTFFCGTEQQTRAHWINALRAGSSVLDMTGALDGESGVLVRAPWLGAQAVTVDLLTAAVVPADPAALTLALLLERMSQAAPVRLAAATVLLPASGFGRAAVDELHQQTVNLLSFQGLPRETFDAQVAFNLLGGLGEAAQVSLGSAGARIRRHYAALSAGKLPALSLQVVHTPVFHGLTFSVLVELERPVDLAVLEEVLSGDRMDLVLEDTDSPSNLAAMGQNDVLVRLRPEPGDRNPALVSRVWIWAACDNLRLHAQNAVDCALDLGRLRPQGTVQ
ncbi:MAG: Asd/ArgC dimerization domain-containing protein [Terracidiphilus sp.]